MDLWSQTTRGPPPLLLAGPPPAFPPRDDALGRPLAFDAALLLLLALLGVPCAEEEALPCGSGGLARSSASQEPLPGVPPLTVPDRGWPAFFEDDDDDDDDSGAAKPVTAASEPTPCSARSCTRPPRLEWCGCCLRRL